MKKISVLIPAFNAAATIELAVESMLWQDVPPGYEYEVHVLDDRSSGGTPAVLEELARRHRGRRLRVEFSGTNLGVVRARNRMLAAVDADYVVTMDADDISLPGRIAAQVAALEAGHDLVGTFVYNFGAMHGDRRYSQNRLERQILAMIDQRSFCHPATAFNRKVARLGYREDPADDYGLLTDVLVAGLGAMTIPRHYLMYRVHTKRRCRAVSGARGTPASGRRCAASGRATFPEFSTSASRSPPDSRTASRTRSFAAPPTVIVLNWKVSRRSSANEWGWA